MKNAKRNETDAFVWMAVGGLGAILLGILLIPLRQLVAPSNLAFLFLAFTIVVAEVGGRGPALITAFLSALSLNFFLTQPYLNLSIEKREDVIAFFALVGCGLIAAGFGKRREQWSDAAKQSSGRLNSLSLLTLQLRKEMPIEEVLEKLQGQFRLASIVVRDQAGHLLAAAPSNAPLTIPKTELSLNSLLPEEGREHRYGAKGFRLPEGGGRLIYRTDRGLFTFDLVEGDSRGMDLEMSQTLAIALYIMAKDLPFQGSAVPNLTDNKQ